MKAGRYRVTRRQQREGGRGERKETSEICLFPYGILPKLWNRWLLLSCHPYLPNETLFDNAKSASYTSLEIGMVNIERTSDSTTSPARGPLRRVVERSCPVFKHHHVRLDFTCALPLHSSETEVLIMARYLLNFKGGYCVARGKNYKLYSTWYKVITLIVMSQLKVQYCCGLLKVLESCFLLLIKATTLWQLMKSIEFESFHLQDFPHTMLRDHCTAL